MLHVMALKNWAVIEYDCLTDREASVRFTGILIFKVKSIDYH